MKNNISANQYIYICCISVMLLVGVNSFYFIMREAFGYGAGTFFFTSQDRFADIIKPALSYKKVLLTIPNLKSNIDSLSPIYQYYFFNNPYGGTANIEGLTHFHMTPISTWLNIMAGIAIGRGISPAALLCSLFSFCVILLFTSTYNIVKCYKKCLLVIVFVVVTYPLLFLVTRGNYQAFFCGIGVLTFLNSLFINNKVSFTSMILFSVAINFRPNAAILLMSAPLLLGVRKSLSPVIQILCIASIIFVSSYLMVNSLYPDYTIETFLKGLSAYYKMYVIGSGGDAFNSSLFGALKVIIGDVDVVVSVFPVLAAVMLLAVGVLFFLKNTNSSYYPFILSSLYILFNQVAADYHLIIFVAPIFLIYHDFGSWRNDVVARNVITIATVLILAPKNYLFSNGISYQVVINPMIMLLTSIYLYIKTLLSRRVISLCGVRS